MFQFHHEWHFDRHDSYPVMNRHQELHNWVLPWNISPGNLLLPCFDLRIVVSPVKTFATTGWMWTLSMSRAEWWNNYLNIFEHQVEILGSWKLIHGDSEIIRDFSFMLSRLDAGWADNSKTSISWGAQKSVLWNCRGAHDFLWARSLCWADLLSQHLW